MSFGFVLVVRVRFINIEIILISWIDDGYKQLKGLIWDAAILLPFGDLDIGCLAVDISYLFF